MVTEAACIRVATPIMKVCECLWLLQLLLSQYSTSKDIVVLTAMAGRPVVELEPLVGWFACGCAIRSSLEGMLLGFGLLAPTSHLHAGTKYCKHVSGGSRFCKLRSKACVWLSLRVM